MALDTPSRGGNRIEGLLRSLLIAAMVTCLASPFVLLMEVLVPFWDGAYFWPFCFLASLEGILSERLLRRQRISGWAYLASRAAELFLLLILLKLAGYLPFGLDQLWFEAQGWLADPDSIFTTIDLASAAVFVPLWLISLEVARVAAEIEGGGEVLEGPPDRNSVAYYEWLTQPSPVRDRQEHLDELGQQFVWGGVVLLIASSVIHALVSSVQALAVPILLYFALGITLLSQARYSVTVTGWRRQGIPVHAALGRRWLAWALLFLLGVSLVALLLPTRYFLGPLLALVSALSLVYYVLLSLLTLLYFLLASLLARFFPQISVPEAAPQPLQPVPLPETAPAGGGAVPWLEVVASALFWATILGILAYTVYRFARDRLDLLDLGEGAELTWWGRLLTWLRALWQRWQGWGQDVVLQLQERRAQRRTRSGGLAERLRGFSLRGLSPRQTVRYFYLSAERRAADAGQARQPGQTPYEYRQSLDDRFPELEPDLEGLTDAFVAARYSAEAVGKEDVEQVKPLWQRIKVALRQRRPWSAGQGRGTDADGG
jgi:hypothetical protein